MQASQPRFLTLTIKTIVCHTITYFVMGALAFHFLDYKDVLNKPGSGLRPATSPFVILGSALQVFRGVVFASISILCAKNFFHARTDGRCLPGCSSV